MASLALLVIGLLGLSLTIFSALTLFTALHRAWRCKYSFTHTSQFIHYSKTTTSILSMASKALLVMGLLLALFLAICSEVAARDLAEKSAEVVNEKEQEAAHVADAKYGGYPGGGYGGYPGGGYGGYPGGGYGGYPGRGGYGGYGGYPGRGGGGYGGGGGCRYGYRYGRCCSYAGEAADLEAEAQTHN